MTKRRSWFVTIASAGAAMALLAGAGSAQAHGVVSWSVGIGVPGVVVGASSPASMPYPPAPVYYTPAPAQVYYVPAPVYYVPAPVYRAPVYYAPPRVHVAPARVYWRGGYGGHWKHR